MWARVCGHTLDVVGKHQSAGSSSQKGMHNGARLMVSILRCPWHRRKSQQTVHVHSPSRPLLTVGCGAVKCFQAPSLAAQEDAAAAAAVGSA